MGYSYNIANPADQEWSDILFDMNCHIKDFCLSVEEQNFLSNLEVLEELKNIVHGCEELETYKQMCSQEGFIDDIWQKIKKFFVDLWNKFVAWFKNIPNWFRPYIKQCVNLRNSLGATVKMDPIPQLVMMVPSIELTKYMQSMNSMKVTPINGVPTLMMLSAQQNNVPVWVTVRGNIKVLPMSLVQINSESELMMWLDSIIGYHNNLDAFENSLVKDFDSYAKITEDNFANGTLSVNPNEIVKAFKEDLQLVMGFQKQLIEIARNLSKVKTKAI